MNARAAVLALAIIGAALGLADASEDGTAWACRLTDGSIRIETGAPARPVEGCRSMALPVPADAIGWAIWVPASIADDDRIVLTGLDRGGDFVPTGARIRKVGGTDAPPQHALPIGGPLLGMVRPQPFGVEERASVAMEDGALQVTCRPGASAAGLTLDPGPPSLPESPALQLNWRSQGDPGFSVGIVPTGAALEAGTEFDRVGRAAVPLPTGTAARNDLRFVVLCPASGGVLTIADLRITAPAPQREPSRAAWTWRPESWRATPESLIETARRLGLDRLFVAVDIDADGLGDREALAAFVARAGAVGMSVVVVEGDPAMVLEAGRAAAVERLRVLAEYQRSAAVEGRLAGVQYDIEPYLLPAYAADPGRILRAWAETIGALGREAVAELDLVLPFWLANDPDAKAIVLPAVAATAKSVTVMAYRTGAAEIEDAARPFLEWGCLAGLPVRIALEAGPVEDEVSVTYAPASEGDLWALPAEGGTILFRSFDSRGGGAARIYAPLHRTRTEASRVSFLGEAGAMMAAAQATRQSLAAWPSFAGFAFHGLLP